MLNVYFYENSRGFVDINDVSDKYVGIDKIEDVVKKIFKDEYNDEVIENIKYWYSEESISVDDVVSYSDDKDCCYIDYNEDLGYWIFKDRDVFDRDDIDSSDIVDVLECEIFDLDLKYINERMFNLISEEK